jgi:hypothetical protein
MTSHVLEKKALLKKRFMEKRYGLFKSRVCRYMQLKYFADVFAEFFVLNDNAVTARDSFLVCLAAFEYLERTMDIWGDRKTFAESVKEKTFKFAGEKDNFKKYLVSFGYVCPYPKVNGEMCGRKSDGVCKIHKRCEERLKVRIRESLFFPKELSDIVFEYTLPYERL